MKYLILGLFISAAAFARDPYGTDFVRTITFDDNYKEMTVKFLEDKHGVYTMAEDSRAGKCIKNAYRGNVKVKIHFSEDGKEIENCEMIPMIPENITGNQQL